MKRKKTPKFSYHGPSHCDEFRRGWVQKKLNLEHSDVAMRMNVPINICVGPLKWKKAVQLHHLRSNDVSNGEGGIEKSYNWLWK